MQRTAPIRTAATRTAASTSRKSTKAAPVPQDLRARILERDDCRCVRCGWPVGAGAWSVHHRQPRQMGGRADAHTAANLLLVCGTGTTGCHGWIESHRADATALGFLCPSWADPAAWPVFRHSRRWEQPGHSWAPAAPHTDQEIAA